MNSKIVVLVVVVIVLMFSAFKISDSDFYDGMVEISDVDFTAQTEKSAVYIYRSDCYFCELIEEEFEEFYDYFAEDNNYDVYLADTTNPMTSVWLRDMEIDLATPKLLEMQNSVVTEQHVGYLEVLDAFLRIMMDN